MVRTVPNTLTNRSNFSEGDSRNLSRARGTDATILQVKYACIGIFCCNRALRDFIGLGDGELELVDIVYYILRGPGEEVGSHGCERWKIVELVLALCNV